MRDAACNVVGTFLNLSFARHLSRVFFIGPMIWGDVQASGKTWKRCCCLKRVPEIFYRQ